MPVNVIRAIPLPLWQFDASFTQTRRLRYILPTMIQRSTLILYIVYHLTLLLLQIIILTGPLFSTIKTQTSKLPTVIVKFFFQDVINASNMTTNTFETLGYDQGANLVNRTLQVCCHHITHRNM